MGYSNVAGDLNVLSTTSTQNLTVRGDTVLYGNLTAAAGFHNFGNLTAANLTVTGNFTITATNTQVTNALSINNAGTSTALKVVQYEGGGPGHIYNVAEFWDFQTLAMVIDAEGNVGIHTTSSPGYSLTVGDGSYLTTVTSQLYTGNGSGLSNLTSSNLVGPLTSLQLTNTQSNITSLGTLVNLNVSGTANIATGWFTTANVTGGLGANTAFFNLLRSNVSNVGILNASNASVSNLLCSNLNVVTTANMTALTVTGILQASLLTGNASGLSNINSSNLVGNVAAANVASSVTNPAQTNITSVGVLSALTVSGIFQAGLLSGNASALSNVNGANVSTVPTAGVVTNPSQVNITSVGQLTSLIVTGVLQADLLTGNASGLSNVNGANVSTVPTAGVVTNPSQINITSVGTLTSLSVQGVSQAGLLVGNASGLSNINSSNLVGNVANANVALVVSQPSQPNVTSVGTLTFLTVSGIFQAGLLSGNASGLSNVNGSNVSTVPTSGVVTNPAQTNITSVGQLTSLIVTGVSQAGLLVGNASGLSNLNSSNLVGNVANANVALVVSQPLQPNITQVGSLTGLYSSGNITATFFTGQGNGLTNVLSSVLVGNVANANVALVVSQPLQPNITQVGTLTGLFSSGNVTATFFTGQGNALTNVLSSVLVGNVANANVALVVSQPSQPNITSVGQLTMLTVSGVLQADLLTGNASGLSNVNGANVSTVPTAQSVTVASQPNITSVGTLTSLSVQGILSSNLFVGNASALSNITGSNVSTVPTAQSVTVASQPNITSVGTLTSISVQGISSSNLFIGNASALSNLNTANVTIGAFSASQLQTAQGNITSVGTLTSLTVSGNSNLQTLNVASIATPGVIPVSSGLFMNLNATYTLNSTGNWSGNIAGSITSNLFTLFGPNPVASWTTYGSNPLITGPTANGGFRFNQTGPYQFTVVLTSDNNIKTIALSSNTSDVHSNLADPGVWLYCYRISVGQDPSVPVQIPFYVDSTSKYYFIDFEAMNKADNIHRTAYTNVTAEGYTGSYVTLRPV